MSRSNHLWFSVFLILTLFHTPVSAADSATPAVLRMHGSNTVGSKLAPELVRQWLTSKGYSVTEILDVAPEQRRVSARNNKGETLMVEINSHGTSTAFADLAADQTDIGMASRPIKPEELAVLKPLGKLNQPNCEYVIALDGLLVIVHPSSPLRELRKDMLRKIFTGEISDWAKAGGTPGKIQVYARDDKSGTYDTFSSLVLNGAPLAANARRYESSDELADAVVHDPAGIGFVGFAYGHSAKQLAIAEPGATPIVPVPFNVGTEDYALSRRLFLYLPEQPRLPLAQDFVNFAVSHAAQKTVEESGYISQAIVANNQAIADAAPQEYKELTRGAERLSLNIRFRPGYAKLDSKAVRDVERLSEFMARPENRSRKLMLFGFVAAHETFPYM
ncbi:MAG: PstS family phosphate ABC transporter substrate-binding protein, partial [Gammaproteobacteria bacterium]|nr:PstS family phosphate ABC transporter substrate-binding protein [Gammaproteobacteria bacterium]